MSDYEGGAYKGLEGLMKSRVVLLVALIAVMISATTSFANVQSDTYYMFPVVVKAFGQGGTDWRSELCVGNLSGSEITVTIMYGSSDYDIDGGWVDIPGDETYCWQDIIQDGFGENSFSGWLWVIADEDDNYGMEVPFTASMRVYNWTSKGTFGVNVPAVNPEAGLFGLEEIMGAATGVQNYGSVGVSGFRTSVGLNSIETEDSQAVAIVVTDYRGVIVWEKSLWLDPMEFTQISLPKNLTVYDGTLALLSSGVVTSYITVVDNRSGDGVYRMPVQFDLGAMGYAKSALTKILPPAKKSSSVSPDEALGKFLQKSMMFRRATGRMSP
jgi:hypothetical protein